MSGLALLPEHPLDHVVVDVELGCNRPDRLLLAVMEAQDSGLELRPYSRRTSAARGREEVQARERH